MIGFLRLIEKLRLCASVGGLPPNADSCRHSQTDTRRAYCRRTIRQSCRRSARGVNVALARSYSQILLPFAPANSTANFRPSGEKRGFLNARGSSSRASLRLAGHDTHEMTHRRPLTNQREPFAESDANTAPGPAMRMPVSIWIGSPVTRWSVQIERNGVELTGARRVQQMPLTKSHGGRRRGLELRRRGATPAT